MPPAIEPDRPAGVRRVVEVMGTVFSVDLRPPLPDPHGIDRIVDWWRWVDATFSPFRPDSQVSRLNRAELAPADAAGEVAEVLTLCRQATQATGGYFDACATGGFDPCGLVKGWSIQLASAMLRAAGSTNHCINGGGDLRCAGAPKPGRRWRVGITDPLRPRRLVASVEVGAGAVATSGTAERGAHVLDPHTRRLAGELASVTVVGPDLTWADAYATAAFAMGKQAWAWLCELEDHEGLVVATDGTTTATPGFGHPTTPNALPVPPPPARRS